MYVTSKDDGLMISLFVCSYETGLSLLFCYLHLLSFS